MKKYTVQELSAIAGVSIRTLHHYDKIGLLIPSHRSEKNYRYYTRAGLLRLQQILFFKELDIPLKEIAEIIDNPDYDPVKALQEHKHLLKQKHKRLKTLIQTIDKTIETMNNNNQMTDEELYEGFPQDKVEAIRQEAKDRWGEDKVTDTENRIKGWGKQRFEEVKRQGKELTQQIADAMPLGADNDEVQQLIGQYYEHLNLFTPTSKQRFLGLGKIYVEDERFTAHYENYKKGLAAFMQEAIAVFCKDDEGGEC